MTDDKLLQFLNEKVAAYNQPFFIKDDPVSVRIYFQKNRILK